MPITMFTTEKSRFTLYKPSANRSLPKNLDLMSISFHENMLRRLKALNPTPESPSISLTWLSQAVDFLSCIHAEAQALVTNLRSTGAPSDDTISSYLDGSIKLLEICNSISSEIELLRQRRLLINFVLHLLDVPGGDRQLPAVDKIRRSRDLLSDWENNLRESGKRRTLQTRGSEKLIGDLAAAIGTRGGSGKISSAEQVLRRTVYAVGVVTVFVAGAAVAALCGLPKDIPAVRVPGEFVWADSFEDLQSAIIGMMKRRNFEGGEKAWLVVEELDDVDKSVRGLRHVINGVVEGGGDINNENVKLGDGVKELEAAMEKFTDGLDKLANGVDGTFRSVLCTRNGMLEKHRKTLY